jgi:hypothetical protein
MKSRPVTLRRVTTLSAALAALSVGACDDAGQTTPTADTSSPSGGDTAGPATCETDADCVSVAVVTCRKAVCGADGTCGSEPVADGTACTTGNACLAGETCTAGVCAGGAMAPAECGGATCGEDACGNSCGTCADGETCEEGACVAAPEACGEVTFEGCCTASGAVKYCNNGVLDTLDCPSDGTVCGWAGDDGFDCHGVPSGDPAGSFPFLCPGEACAETCGARECGFACGEACGTGCGEGELCSPEGTCEPHPCGDVGYIGCCNADGSATYCDNDELITVDCAAEYGERSTCGWTNADNGYFCNDAQDADPTSEHPFLCGGQTCTETCDTRACGSVCGQTCAGTCGAGEACDEHLGQCIPDPCGDLPDAGCCDGDRIYWCSGIILYTFDCVGADAQCGWEVAEDPSESSYFCTDNQDASPDVSLPRSCDGYSFDKTTAVEPQQ